jgi:hypothetical protein
VTEDRTRTIAAAVEVYQQPGSVAAGRQRPFAGNAIAVNGFELYITGYRPKRSHFVKTLTTLRPSDRPGL